MNFYNWNNKITKSPEVIEPEPDFANQYRKHLKVVDERMARKNELQKKLRNINREMRLSL